MFTSHFSLKVRSASVPNSPFLILVADSDPIVGVVGARLLTSALDTQLKLFPASVRVLQSQSEIDSMYEPVLPHLVQAITQKAQAVEPLDIENAKLIVGFAGLAAAKVNSLRTAGVSAPAVNLCQFVLFMDLVAQSPDNLRPDVQGSIVSAALQSGFEGASDRCEICADTVQDSIHYWINIADTCSRFAQTVQRMNR